jgi:1-aminocyclopropane-1-carboxylate deaminase
MVLYFISRTDYLENKGRNGAEIRNNERIWYIPEGGANEEGVEGCKEIMHETSNDFDYVFVAQGTTATSMGILSSMNANTTLVVVPVLKGFDSLKEMRKMAQEFNLFYDESKIVVLDGYHFGGYARVKPELISFIEQFNKTQKFRIEARYTGKVMYALNEFVSTKKLSNKKVLFVHTGGLYNN